LVYRAQRRGQFDITLIIILAQPFFYTQRSDEKWLRKFGHWDKEE